MKTCKKCNEIKEIDQFYKDKNSKDGYMNFCKKCKKEYGELNKISILNKKKEYYLKNKEKLNSYNKTYYSENKEDLLKKSKEYYSENKESKIEYQNNYYLINKDIINENKRNNREKINEKYNNRYNNDRNFRTIKIIRTLITKSFRNNGYTKKSKSFEILGCDFNFFKIYIEKQFTEGMNWGNQGEWHLDHKIPISWATTEEEIYKLNHYTNFQPLWELDNKIKNNKYATI
jgi:hypothetical protein